MWHNPWQANCHSANQKIPCLLWYPKVHYRVHNNPPLVPILSQMNSVHNYAPYLSKIRCNIFLPSLPRPSERSLPFRFSDHDLLCIYSFHACYIPYPSHPSWFGHPNNSWWSLQIMHLLQHPTNFTLIRPHFSSAPVLKHRSSFNVRDQVSYPYKTTCKLTVLHILMYKFLYRRR
jgi:hypothetical protein